MLDADGNGDAEFTGWNAAFRAIELFVRKRDRKDEWLFRLNVIDAASNLRYVLHARQDVDVLRCRPELLPCDFAYPKVTGSCSVATASEGRHARVDLQG